MTSVRKLPVYYVYARDYLFSTKDHAPLSLGMIIACAKGYQGGILQEKLEFLPRSIYSEDDLQQAFRKYGPGVFLFSDYVWSVKKNLEFSQLAKTLSNESVIIHGGPSAPSYPDACREFLEEHPYIDIMVRGEGEITGSELLLQLVTNWNQPDFDFLDPVQGITYRLRSTGQIVRTPDRERIKDLDQLPSPYLTGVFTREEAKEWVAAVMETNRGCPYGCTFCDWGSATLQNVRVFSLERVKQELEWIARNRVELLWVADANFGILKRDVELAEIVCQTKEKYGYPKRIMTNYAKNATKRLAEIIRLFNNAGMATQGIISIQTQDPHTLENIRRSNIKTERYEELISIFRQEQLPISSDLMIGLPGQTVESFKNDLQFFFDRQVFPSVYPTVLLPNSPMADPEYMKQHDIRVDENSTIISSSSFTPDDISTMAEITDAYAMMVGSSMLKYWLYYLQIDHGIRALDFVHNFVEDFERNAEVWLPMRIGKSVRHRRLGLLWNLYKLIYKRADRPMRRSDWRTLYKEIAAYTCRRYKLPHTSGIDTVMAVQEALMPSPGRSFPERLPLQHDMAAYVQQYQQKINLQEHTATNPKPLHMYGPGELVITDPHALCNEQRGWDDKFYVDDHMTFWELTSPLMPAIMRKAVRHKMKVATYAH